VAQTQISDVVVPAEFTAYIADNSMVSTALYQSGVAVPNGVMSAQLQAGAEQFTIPMWMDAGETEADITCDDPTILATPLKIAAEKQTVRKSYLHASWSEMSLASELSGSDALARVQSRVQAYWDRQWERRLIASMLGVLYSNVANNSSDMVNDISGASGTIIASTNEFFEDKSKQLQWTAFNGKNKVYIESVPLKTVVGDIEQFVMPLVLGVATEGKWSRFWRVGGPRQD